MRFLVLACPDLCRQARDRAYGFRSCGFRPVAPTL